MNESMYTIKIEHNGDVLRKIIAKRKFSYNKISEYNVLYNGYTLGSFVAGHEKDFVDIAIETLKVYNRRNHE